MTAQPSMCIHMQTTHAATFKAMKNMQTNLDGNNKTMKNKLDKENKTIHDENLKKFIIQ